MWVSEEEKQRPLNNVLPIYCFRLRATLSFQQTASNLISQLLGVLPAFRADRWHLYMVLLSTKEADSGLPWVPGFRFWFAALPCQQAPLWAADAVATTSWRLLLALLPNSRGDAHEYDAS